MKQLKQQYFRPVLPLFREHRAGLLACLGCLCLLFSALPLAAADRFVSFSNGDFLLNEGGKVGILSMKPIKKAFLWRHITSQKT